MIRAFKQLHEQLHLLGINKAAAKRLKVRVSIVNSERGWREYGTKRFSSGVALPEVGEIYLVGHLALAPREVVRHVFIHECLHLFWPFAKKTTLSVRDFIRSEYPEDQHQEEEWVRRAEEQICGRDDCPLVWEAAIESMVEKGEKNWRPAYEEMKRRLASRR